MLPNQDSKHPQRRDLKFGEAHPERDNWKDYPRNAEAERGVMVAEFHAWLVKTRIKTEQKLLQSERYQHEIAPFADAGMQTAPTPREVPLVVLEFAHITLEVMELKRKLTLLNVYYEQAANVSHDTTLNIEPGNEAEVNDLWDWFIGERNQSQ